MNYLKNNILFLFFPWYLFCGIKIFFAMNIFTIYFCFILNFRQYCYIYNYTKLIRNLLLFSLSHLRYFSDVTDARDHDVVKALITLKVFKNL